MAGIAKRTKFKQSEMCVQTGMLVPGWEQKAQDYVSNLSLLAVEDSRRAAENQQGARGTGVQLAA